MKYVVGKKYTFEFVKVEFEKRGYILLENTYINGKTKMRYMCPEHPNKDISISFFKLYHIGRGCPYCNGGIRLNYNIVKEYFDLEGYFLLDKKYKNSSTPMQYKCPNHPDEYLTMSWDNFKQGKRCPICTKENQKGKGHWSMFKKRCT